MAGIIHWDGEPVSETDLKGMSALLHHRGPDEFGTALPSAGAGLSHARLKVIDLSAAARQPMADETQTLWLCFNGEIYNFLELRRELEAAGRKFRSRSDTEVILHAYETWGTSAFAKLDGMFAIALWDVRNRELLLARDRTGKKPLYYWTDGRCLAFGSEIKALAAHFHVPRRVNEEVLSYLLAFGHPPSGETCYQQIRQVLPATWMRFSPEKREPSAVRYWNLPAEPPAVAQPAGEAAAELKRLLDEAVQRRLISDVPLGAFLSGGLDSTAVVALMAARMDRPVKTFSIGFEGDSRYNETSYARLAAAQLKTDHTEFIIKPQPFELLERIVWHLDQPFGDSSAVPAYLLCQLARSKVTVALNGDGGDELFAGYDRFRAALLAERIPVAVRRLGSRIVRSMPMGGRERSAGGRLRRFFEAAPEELEKRLLRWTCYFGNPKELLRSGRGRFSFPSLAGGGERFSPLQRLLRLNFQEYLPNDLHVKMDRCSMGHGLETRSPFLDTALVEWAFRLPDSLKLRGSEGKWILRQAFRGLLPPEILRRKKMGFGVPLGSWFRKEWRDPLQDTLRSPQARIRQYLRPEAVDRLLLRHLKGKEDAGQRLWLLLTFELWLRQMDRRPATP
ncbi:MAG: asparagine synthase (glutamine-hydrolyzing) [Candidatus Omnitrophota bacterium]|nr:asparagine synthase (glutamine-hydrolyzing) [Candidatus Omnitrophota bacterium]